MLFRRRVAWVDDLLTLLSAGCHGPAHIWPCLSISTYSRCCGLHSLFGCLALKTLNPILVSNNGSLRRKSRGFVNSNHLELSFNSVKLIWLPFFWQCYRIIWTTQSFTNVSILLSSKKRYNITCLYKTACFHCQRVTFSREDYVEMIDRFRFDLDLQMTSQGRCCKWRTRQQKATYYRLGNVV